jgi:hypothetical protein
MFVIYTRFNNMLWLMKPRYHIQNYQSLYIDCKQCLYTNHLVDDEFAIPAVFAIVLLQGHWTPGSLHDHFQNLHK